MSNNLDRILSKKEYLIAIGWLVTAAVTWGSMTAKLSEQENKVRSLAPVPEQLAVLNERIGAIDKRTAATERLVQRIWSHLLSNR